MSWRRLGLINDAIRGRVRATDDEDASASDILVQIILPMVIVLAVWTLALAQEAERKQQDIEGQVGEGAMREKAELIKELQRWRLLDAVDRYLANKRQELHLDSMPASAIVDLSGRVTNNDFRLLSENAHEWLGSYHVDATSPVITAAYHIVLDITSIGDCEPLDTARARGPCSTPCGRAALHEGTPIDNVIEIIRAHRSRRERILEDNRIRVCRSLIDGVGGLSEQVGSVQGRVVDELASIYLAAGRYRDLLPYGRGLEALYESLAAGDEPTADAGQDPMYVEVQAALRCQLRCQEIEMLPLASPARELSCPDCTTLR